MTKIIDARNLSCPQPVVLTKNALEEVDEVVTIVDNEAARDNVSRLGKSQGCEVTVEQKDDGIYLTLKTAGDGQVKQQCVAVNLEYRVRNEFDRNQNVAGRSAQFAGAAHAL